MKVQYLKNKLFNISDNNKITQNNFKILLGGRCGTTLEKVLTFSTGSDQIPPLGFNPLPSIKFWDDVRPRANTCDLTLYLPLFPKSSNEVEYEDFKEKMDDGILNSPIFGFA